MQKIFWFATNSPPKNSYEKYLGFVSWPPWSMSLLLLALSVLVNAFQLSCSVSLLTPFCLKSNPVPPNPNINAIFIETNNFHSLQLSLSQLSSFYFESKKISDFEFTSGPVFSHKKKRLKDSLKREIFNFRVNDDDDV